MADSRQFEANQDTVGGACVARALILEGISPHRALRQLIQGMQRRVAFAVPSLTASSRGARAIRIQEYPTFPSPIPPIHPISPTSRSDSVIRIPLQ